MSKEDAVYRVATALGGCVPKVGRAEGKQDRGGSSFTGSCAHVDLDPAEICGVAGDRIYQGKECDTLGPRIRREEAELRRSALLGARVLCLHSSRDQEVIREYIRKQEEEDKR